MKHNDDDYAFPSATVNMLAFGPRGMTLRDYMAARVIVSFIADGFPYDFAAKRAYAVADAMLRVREP